MRHIRKRLTYANTMSTIAVFLVVAGGSAVAANQLGKNTVGAKQLKKNAVTAAKIKKNAVTTAKIKNNAITGAKLDESSLGTVPSATNATNAVNATNAENAANFNRFHRTGIVKLAIGETKQILTVGPFSFHTRCTKEGGTTYVESFATTTQPGSNIASYEEEYNESDFNPGEESEVGYGENSSGSPIYANWGYGGYYSGFNAASGDGNTLLSGEVTNMVNSYGSPCAVWMFAIEG